MNYDRKESSSVTTRCLVFVSARQVQQLFCLQKSQKRLHSHLRHMLSGCLVSTTLSTTLLKVNKLFHWWLFKFNSV